MKNVRQIICFLLTVATLFIAVSCARSTGPSENPADTTEAKETTASEDTTTEPDDTTAEPPKLSEELKLEIQKAYAEKVLKPIYPTATYEDCNISYHWASFGDAHVVIMSTWLFEWPAEISYITINGITIEYGGAAPRVYLNGMFYGIEEAYEKGILTDDNLRVLAD